MIKYLTYSLIVFSLFFFSCEKMPDKYPCDNTKDPDCPGYITGSAIVLEERYIETTVNSEFEIFISLEEVDNVLGAFISISFDPDIVNLTGLQALSSIISTSLTDVVFIATEVQEANNGGLIELNMARFGGESGNSNAKQIVCLKFQAISVGETQINLNPNSELRDTYNNVIKINKLVNAIIKIQ